MKPSAFIKRHRKTRFSVASITVLIVALLAVSGCKEDCPLPYQLDIPEWFSSMEIPEDNRPTKARVELGRKLFYEPLLSLDSTVSCSSCHLPQNAFSDSRELSLGVAGATGMRNAPTLANVGYAPYFFHDGGVETLELQSQSPIFSVDEMSFTIAGFLNRIENNQEYLNLFEQAYNRAPDAFGISRAIATFERTMISGNSRFDQFYYKNESDALSDSEKRGMHVFMSADNNCVTCHQLPLFTNYEFENIGLYSIYADSGRARISHQPEDNGKFKVPTLRNIQLTSPYMHDGSLATLDEVVNHFNSGGVGHANQSSDVKPLGLTEVEKADLVAFLRSLTDQSFINNPELVE